MPVFGLEGYNHLLQHTHPHRALTFLIHPRLLWALAQNLTNLFLGLCLPSTASFTLSPACSGALLLAGLFIHLGCSWSHLLTVEAFTRALSSPFPRHHDVSAFSKTFLSIPRGGQRAFLKR